MTAPPWIMPPDLATIVAEDGEWEDPSWDPLLLTVVGDSRFEGRAVPMAWQLSLWPGDLSAAMTAHGPGREADGHQWADWLRAGIAVREPRLIARTHDDSDAATCVLWVESEADGRLLLEAGWRCLHPEG